MNITVPHMDLTKQAPRSFRVRLGGFVTLPRILDKGRAALAGKNGEYNYNSPTDKRLAQFIGLDMDQLLQELAKGKGDDEILEWIQANARIPRAPWEIASWSQYFETRGPDSDGETLQAFADYLGQHSKTREDVKTWFEAIELDDYASFGGKA